MKPNPTENRRFGFALLLLGALVFVFWGIGLARARPMGMLDFKALYYSASCLVHHQDPYNQEVLRAFYQSQGGGDPSDPPWLIYTLSLINYLPIAFPILAPFALLPWNIAQWVWTVLLAGSFLFGCLLFWRDSAKSAPLLSGILIGLLLANSPITLAGGNAAGLVIGLCAIAVWCFLQNRFALLGTVCLAVSLALKPHDAGLIWLYLLLAGGVGRKRAAQALAANLVLGAVALLWVHQVAPHWLPELRSVMAIYNGPGGANNPGVTAAPGSAFRSFNMPTYPGMVCDLQSVIAAFRDDPRFYNPATYLICAPFLLVWAYVTVRAPRSREAALLAIAAVVPFTLLITYHRTTDAKLVLLTVPACALLWAAGGAQRWLAAALTGFGIFITGDIPLVVIGMRAGQPDWATAGLLRRIELVITTRPVPLVLFAMGVFYLWAYTQHARSQSRQAGVDVQL